MEKLRLGGMQASNYLCDVPREDMMAISLPNGGLKSFVGNTPNSDETMCRFYAADCFQSISKEHMHQIRNTMIRQEETFKEQVKALHELYNVQRVLMQKVRQAISSQACVANNSDAISDLNSQVHRFDVEGKTIRSAGVTSKDYSGVPHVFSRHPIWMNKEFISPSSKESMSKSNTDFRPSPRGKNKLRIEIDLEKPPEDYIEDTEIQAETNNHEKLGTSHHFSESTLKKFQGSHVGSNFSSVLQAGPANLNQIDMRSQIIGLPYQIQVSQQERAQAPETNTAEVGAIGACNQSQTLKHNTLKDLLSNHISAAGSSLVCDKSTPSPNLHTEMPFWLHQGGSSFAAQGSKSSQSSVEDKYSLERTSNKAKEGNNSVSAEVCQTFEREYTDGIENNERNNTESLGIKPLNDGGISILNLNSDITFEGEDDEPVQMDQVVVEGVAQEFINNEIQPSLSSSIPGFEANRMDQSDHSTGSPENIVTWEDAAGITKNNAGEKETTQEEACESIAAKILLSLAPGKSKEDTNVEDRQTQMTMESTVTNRDATGHDRKRSLRVRRSINYNDGDFVDGTVKWTKPLPGRKRSLRRTR